jgi:hypothetical protein
MKPPRALTEVLGYRNERVITSFRKSYSLGAAASRELFRDVLRFLWLAAETKRALPIHSFHFLLDEMWHAFVLHTRDYAVFCDKYMGRFMHHTPNSRTPPRVARRMTAATAARHDAELTRLVRLVCRELGEETAIRWFRTYPERYDGGFIDAHRVPAVGRVPIWGEAEARKTHRRAARSQERSGS